jgi:alcohol dehydrogenase class IV
MHFLPIKEPIVIRSNQPMDQLATLIKQDNRQKIMIITQSILVEQGLLNTLIYALHQHQIEYVIYQDALPNPTISLIENARVIYLENRCDGLIALGGGSAIDLAKGVAARIARPNRSIQKMKGILKVGKKIPPLYAIPTTSGTGSEATLACVVMNATTKDKFSINDPVLIPKVAVLDPTLTFSLLKDMTSTSGMDALTHAIEAYLGRSNTRRTKQYAITAIKTIFENILIAYQEPNNLAARKQMQIAAYQAGVAFTRAYVGNVHAVAHTLSAFYHVPHGLANAVILPHVLEYYGKRIDKKLAFLADQCHLTLPSYPNRQKAQAFIEAIYEMNRLMNIPTSFDQLIKNEDIPHMIKRAKAEANPLYPVPVIMDDKAFRRIYSLLQD